MSDTMSSVVSDIGPTLSQANSSQPPPPSPTLNPSLTKIRTLLKTKDDTSRFVGLALLKSLLDNEADLRQEQAALSTLWDNIPPRFLDRLLRSGSHQQQAKEGEEDDAKVQARRAEARAMLDLAVSVMHTFVVLLPEEARRGEKMVGRMGNLLGGLVASRDETTRLLLETLLSLASLPEGAAVLTGADDLSPLVEMAPSQPRALDVLSYAWITSLAASSAASSQDREGLQSRLDSTISSLMASFSGSVPVRLLEFLNNVLRNSDSELLPPNPTWLAPAITLIRGMFQSASLRDVFTDPASAAHHAPYTNLAATLLQTYPVQSPSLLFSPEESTKGKGKETSTATDQKPFPYLFISLLLIDLRATLPSLLAQLNTPSYAAVSTRLASAFDVLSSFIGYLVRSMDASDTGDFSVSIMPPDLLLQLRRNISETISLAMTFLRDRWDASIAGALGLHPDAVAAEAVTNKGVSRPTLAWDAAQGSGYSVADDPLTLAGVRAAALWLREDGNERLAAEGRGLMDMLVELYQGGSSKNGGSKQQQDYRSAILVALDAILVKEDGVQEFLQQGGWQALEEDLLSLLDRSSSPEGIDQPSASRGIEIVRAVLLPIATDVRPGTRAEWEGLITKVAAWPAPDAKRQQKPTVTEFQVAVLELVTTLLERMPHGVRRRYEHTKSALVGVAKQLLEGRRGGNGGDDLGDELEEIVEGLMLL